MSTTNKKDALGKGIRSLLQNIDTDLKNTAGNLKSEVVEQAAVSTRIALDQIEVNPKQPRHDFDEATSSLDSITEDEITQTIKGINNSRNMITIIIAHRLSTIMHANRIFVLEKGKIIEEGNHFDLLDSKGLYYAMWRQQIGERRV